MNKRNSTLDVLKGVAIILIVITHYSWTDAERLRYLFPFWVDMAVPIFMVITGYVYSKSYVKKNVSGWGEAYSIKLILDRFIRYTVPFAILFVPEAVLQVVLGTVKGVGQIALGFICGGYGYGGYYYPVMLQLVLLFPVIYFIIKRFDFAGLAICWALNAVYEIFHAAIGMPESVYRLLVFRYIFVVAFGCFLAIGQKKVSMWFWWVLAVVAVAFMVVAGYGFYSPVVLKDWTDTCLVAVMFVFPLMALMVHKSIGCGVLEKLGLGSYNIFLMQKLYYCVPVWKVLSMMDNRLVQLLVNIVVCCVAGYVFFLIEGPLTKKLIGKVVYGKG